MIPFGCRLLFLTIEMLLDQESKWPRKESSPEAMIEFYRHYRLSRVSSRYLDVGSYCSCPYIRYVAPRNIWHTIQRSFVTATLVLGPNPKMFDQSRAPQLGHTCLPSRCCFM